MMRATWLAVLAALAAPPAAAQGKDTARLDSVSVHLFLSRAGELSRDVASFKNFFARNSSLHGEGAPEDRFESFLVRVRLTAPREIFAEGPQAEVIVTDRRSRRVIGRERIANVYIGSHGFTHVPVFVPNASCGPYDIAVTGGGRRIVRTLEATCGE